jgi:hypothetical protein
MFCAGSDRKPEKSGVSRRISKFLEEAHKHGENSSTTPHIEHYLVLEQVLVVVYGIAV